MPRRAGLSVSLLALALALGACGARTTLSSGPEPDAGVRTRDGSIRDAGRDGETRDAGPIRPSCTADSDCTDGTSCIAEYRATPLDLTPLPLVCGVPAVAAPDRAPCRAQRDCARGLCVVAGTCVEPCDGDADCDAGERCVSMYVTTSASTMQTLDGCALEVSVPDTVTVTGPTSSGRVNGADTWPALEPNALVVYVAGRSSYVLLESVTRPDGTIAYDAFAGGLPGDPPPAWGVTPTTVAPLISVMYPNGPATPPLAAGARVSLQGDVDETPRRFVAHRDAPGARFDIDAYLVGGGGWTSPDGEMPAPLRRLIDGMRALLADRGLTIGTVRVHEVVGGLRSRYAVLEGDGGIFGNPEELPELHILSAGARLPSVNVFFVREMDQALGIASGIPGAQILHGTGASGVAIAVDLIPARELASVVTHEVGHYMGLFHTSEVDGSVNDPLPDTEICGPDRDANGDGFLAPGECTGAGGDLLMFWAGAGTRITPQQGEVMRRAFFVR